MHAGIVLLAVGTRKIVRGLQVQPEMRIDAEIAAEPNGRTGGGVAPTAND